MSARRREPAVMVTVTPPPGLPPFVLFGMGARRKLLYSRGFLHDALTGEMLRHWPDAVETWEPAEYRLELESRGQGATLWEDEEALWLMDHSSLHRLSAATVNLPTFAGHPHAALLRRLHHEILVNLVPVGPSGHLAPVPNLLTYRKPWYRDAAMVLMVLARTGNLPLVADWVMGLREPYDRNNAGVSEPDNLGQALYMIALVSSCGTPDIPVGPAVAPDVPDRSVGRTHDHPLVPLILQEAQRCRRGNYLLGLTDGAEHPVYQTKWLKLGLRALGLDDPWEIPPIYDPYSALFWMDFRDQHVPGEPFSQETGNLYPYLTWAEAHFHDASPPQDLSPTQFPLTWEAQASEANYPRMNLADGAYAQHRLCTPHTWHAAEMWLYLHACAAGSDPTSQ